MAPYLKQKRRQGLNEEAEFDAEQFAEKLAQQRQQMEATMKVYQQVCPGASISFVA